MIKDYKITEINHDSPQKKLISVIIPAYNQEKYLSKCLDSIINQTYKIIEIIIVNDCSTDGTNDIISEYEKKDKRIRVFKNRRHIGAGKARNIGVAKSNGDYIAFIDSDDFISKDYLEKMLYYIEESDFVCSGYNQLNKNSIKKYQMKPNHYVDTDKKFNVFFNTVNENLFMRAVWGKLFKREIVIRNMFEGLEFGEDTLFLVNVLAQSHSYNTTNYVGYYYRVHDRSTLARSSRKSKEYIRDMMEMEYLSYTITNQLSDYCLEESKKKYKKIFFDMFYKLKKWDNDKNAFIINRFIFKENYMRLKNIIKLTLKDKIILTVYFYCPRLLWRLL